MKAIVICPDRMGHHPFLSRRSPVALAPAFGPSLLGHTLARIADAGGKKVTILASDRPAEIRSAVGKGERWGLTVEVVAVGQELAVEQARQQYRTGEASEWLPEGKDVWVAGDLGQGTLTQNGQTWYEGLLAWLPRAHEHRIGFREIAPGVWVGLRARIESGAHLEAPCWIGEGAWIRSGARIGPGAIVEDEVFVDHDAEVVASWVGPWTYVGALTHVNRSLAWGRGLLSYCSDSFIEVPDAFLLSDLKAGAERNLRGSLIGRFAALLALIFTLPVLVYAWLKSRQAGVTCLTECRAVVPLGAGERATVREVAYHEFAAIKGLWCRWPQLWSIVRGDFAWIGNRPISREQCEELTTEFEQMWLAAPIGIFSLADAEGCREAFDDEARAHSSFYSAQAGASLDRRIFRQVLPQLFNPTA